MRIHFIAITFLLFALPSQSILGKDHSKRPPNIIVVFIDDMGWSDLTCFGGDGPKTEQIDRLAAEGIRFTQFYVNAPICSPSRVAISTGQYPQRWRITSYLNHRRANERRGMAQWLDPEAPMLARELQKAGYATGHFGKWHMGGQRNVADAPPISDYGFDESLTNFEGMGPKLLPLTMEPGWSEPGRIWEKAVNLGGPVTWMQRSHITEGFVQAACEFIENSATTQKPFYLNLWPDDVHTPLFPPLAKWNKTQRGRYLAVLDAMDEQLGPLFSMVRSDSSLRENTLIIVCSDNGPHPGVGNSEPLRGYKTWLYEGGVRSPLIVWGPGLINETANGTINETSVFSAIDLNRSLYEICGITVPENVQLDGENLADVILGHSTASRQRSIYWRRPPDRSGFGFGLDEDNPDLAVRSGKWKFYVNYDRSDPQLYDLSFDAAEEHNVANDHPETTKDLQKAVIEWNNTLPPDAGMKHSKSEE